MNTPLNSLRSATLAARAKTGDSHISTQVAKGLVDVVRAVPPTGGRGRYAVTVLRAGMTPAQAIAYLEAMQ